MGILYICIMKTGIYKITIIGKDCFYIGSAINFTKRKNEHLRLLRKGVHYNLKLQNIYNKYGVHVFVFTLIHECDSVYLITNEQHYIDTLKPKLNICKIANSTLGLKFKRSEEFKKNLSIQKKGIKRGYDVKIYKGSEHVQAKKIYRVDKIGNKVYYGSISEVKKDGFVFQNVWRALKKKGLHKGYKWYYVE